MTTATPQEVVAIETAADEEDTTTATPQEVVAIATAEEEDTTTPAPEENEEGDGQVTVATAGEEQTVGIETQPETQYATQIVEEEEEETTSENQDEDEQGGEDNDEKDEQNASTAGGGMMHGPGMGLGPPPEEDGAFVMVGAPAYGGFWCGPPGSSGLDDVLMHCNSRPICKNKRVEDGEVGPVPIAELEDGQPDNCMRRCDPNSGLEGFCEEDQECHGFVLDCPCPNLNTPGCHAWH